MAFQCQLFIRTLLVMHAKRDFVNEETFTLAIFLAKMSAILWCNYTILGQGILTEREGSVQLTSILRKPVL
jgi:hypothetical protein